ncbi:MAG: hypothetical protein WDO16_07765 [Bacteroidota bacterium]
MDQLFRTTIIQHINRKEILEKLDPEALSNLQAEVLKVYYKNNDLGGADGFINFYQKNVQAFVSSPFRVNANVSSPFRVNANLNFQIDYCKDDINKFYVQETMSWICKSNGGKIQQNVSWVPGESEFEKINDFEVSIQHKSLLSNTNPTGTEFFSFDRLKNEGCTATNNMGFSLPLKNYSSIDDLYIIVKVNCIISKERFIAWRMSLPTRGMTLTVQFPKELRMETEFYFDENNPIHYEKTSKSGYYYLHVEDWIMPDQGITIQLLKLNEGNKA